MLLTLPDVISLFKGAKRIGAGLDVPEGSRYVQISDTLMAQIIEALERSAGQPADYDEH